MKPPAILSKLIARRARWMPWFNRIVTASFVALILWLLVSRAQSIEWDKVGAALQEMQWQTLAIAGVFVLLSYLLYGVIDWFARIYTRKVRRLRQLAIAVVCYAFNLNLGSLIGSVGFRYRLYARHKVPASTVAQIVALALLTNWSGYCLLAGVLFAGRFVALPQGWELGETGLQVFGIGMLLVLASYIGLCARLRSRPLRFRGRELPLPGWRMALLQVVASSANWLAIAGVIYVLLHEHVSYGAVLAAFLLSSVAGAMAHVPGGLGVLEAVFFALLGGSVPQHELLAGLLAFRAIYYLVPLLLAGLLYGWLEWRAPGRLAHSRKARGSRSRRARRRQALREAHEN